MHVWHHTKSNMNEQWDLHVGGHKYAYKINHKFNFEFSCDFQSKKYSICYYFNFFELFLNIMYTKLHRHFFHNTQVYGGDLNQ